MKIPIRLLCCLIAIGGSIMDASEWVSISEPLIASVPEYDGSIPGARGVAGIAVDRQTGDCYAGLNGPPYGVYKSSDAGMTWQRIDGGQIFGGWVRSASMQVDPDHAGRLAVFRVWPPGKWPEGGDARRADGELCQSGVTLDGGETWRVFSNPRFFHSYTGWRHGMVDWSSPDAQRIIADGRIRSPISVSGDGGQTWTEARKKYIGVVDHGYPIEWVEQGPPEQYVNAHAKWLKRVCKGYGMQGEALLLGTYTGIERSADGGDTWTPVADHIVGAITPVLSQGRLYWAAEAGVIVSDDAGASWTLLGSPREGARKGPYFGSSNNELVVVCEDGVYRSTDAAATWSKISKLFVVQDAWRAGEGDPLTYHDYAYDPTRKLLYVSGFAGSAFRKEVP